MEQEPKFVVFTCNWNAHESLQAAGKQRLHYPAGARPLKVDCLGQVSASVILKAFEKGADGVMLVGCSPEECHYEFGSRRAAELFAQVRELSRLLGFRDEQLAFHQIHAGEGEALIEQVRSFAARLTPPPVSNGGQPISPPLEGGAPFISPPLEGGGQPISSPLEGGGGGGGDLDE